MGGNKKTKAKNKKVGQHNNATNSATQNGQGTQNYSPTTVEFLKRAPQLGFK